MTDDRRNSVDPPRRKERRKSASQEWKENPVETYLRERKEDMTARQWQTAKTRIQLFEEHLEENSDIDDLSIREVVEDDVESFISEVLDPDPEKTDKTGSDILVDLRKFYEMLTKKNAIQSNPVQQPLENYISDGERKLDSPDRPYIPFENMKYYVNWLTHPFTRAFVLQGLKHGVRTSEVINIDLRCVNIDYPVFKQIKQDHNVVLDPRVRNKPDSIVIYEAFNEGDEIPNEETPGPETSGEVRDKAGGNKRSEKGGSVLPLDSELKTALVHWLLIRPPTYHKNIHPLYSVGGKKTRRHTYNNIKRRLWDGEDVDSIRQFGRERTLESCPDCGSAVTEQNFVHADKTGRRYRCSDCGETHWRTIMHEVGLKTEQKVTYHQFRHYFSDAHRIGKSEIHDGEMPEFIRKKRIRGDSNQGGDTDDTVYSSKQYQDWENDVRPAYLDAVYKFDLYDTVIPAVGEGWEDE